MHTRKTDILILGSGGAGLLAALAARDRAPGLDILVAVKGLFGKSGCTRMVQGGYNAALSPGDSAGNHFLDTLEGGAWINDQELAWTLVSRAPDCVRRLETVCGCFFDRNPDGTIHQKAFAGQSFDRTVHKGDLTGIEITNRVSEQLVRRGVPVLEEHRAVALLPARGGEKRIAGALLLDIRTGEFVAVNTKCTLLATGGGPTLYRISACAQELSTDGMAIAWEAGAEFCDMEMVQFHPTGILTGEGLQITGTLLEEGLRGAGGHLKNALGERYMARYDAERMERSTRDVVARAGYTEIIEGRGTGRGGVFIDVSHLGRDFVWKNFKGMAERCRDLGYDLAGGPVEVTPTAHYMMGGVKIDPGCRTSLPGLFAAGEDAGGTHGANRLGGNGVANSTVFGEIAGEVMAEAANEAPRLPFDPEAARRAEETALSALGGDGSPYPIRAALKDLMWEKVGLRRTGARIEEAIGEIAELRERAARTRAGGGKAYNLAWQHVLDVRNQLAAAELIARSALERDESRGSHFRDDIPHPRPEGLYNIFLRKEGAGFRMERRPVRFTRMRPGEARIAPVSSYVD
ncbi:MAG: FAD-binding protein [Candidatus Tectomicrobia bacterium]|nr:FAD-binding protein [Candidatus Tectomicrobia bacterium]